MMAKKTDEKKASEVASMGGVARAKNLSKAQRGDIARKAAAARWGNAPRQTATHTGEIQLGNLSIPCAVLEDGTRVISGRGMTTSIGMKGRGQGVARIVTHPRIKPYLDSELALAIENPLIFNSGAPLPTQGYQADVLVQLCEAILRARDDNALHTEQELRYARSCELIVRALAHVGIVALVDEATGFQDVRPRDALAKILEAFVAKELRKWVSTFPPEFYKQMFRLRGLPYDGSVKRPGYVGHLTNDIVYARLAPGVLRELRDRNPAVDGRRKHRHFQWLTQDIGHPKLQEHLVKVTTLMQVSDDWSGFKSLLDRGFQKYSKLPLFRDIQDDE